MRPREKAPTRRAWAGLLVACLAGCAPAATSDTVLQAPQLVSLDNPAPVGSAQPAITLGRSGRLYLSWQERRPDSSVVVRFATRASGSSTGWSAVRDIATGRNVVASAVDVPSVHEAFDGGLVAIWRGSHARQGYDVLLAHSGDNGATWSPPASPHRDATTAEHGFVSWLQLGDTSAIVWVDGRHNSDADTATRAAALMLARFDASGAPQPETVLDARICDCCHTSSARVPGGTVVVYRDRHAGEIRDISAVRAVEGTWKAPVSVHDDGWHISGCPVNGPAVAAAGDTVAVAWFTAANDSARVRLAFSRDTANTFGTPVEINEGFPDGRVGVVLAPSSHVAVVSWIERRGAVAVLRVRAVRANGTRSPAADVAELGEGKRAGGAPKLLVAGDEILLVWADAASNRVRSAAVHVP